MFILVVLCSRYGETLLRILHRTIANHYISQLLRQNDLSTHLICIQRKDYNGKLIRGKI